MSHQSPILGKWQEVGEEGLSPFLQALGLPDPAPDTQATFEWKVEGDGDERYTEIFDNEASDVTSRNFTSGVESDDGITTIVNGNTILETDKLPDGKIMSIKRVFDRNQMISFYTSPNTDAEATITFKKINS